MGTGLPPSYKKQGKKEVSLDDIVGDECEWVCKIDGLGGLRRVTRLKDAS